MKQSRGTQKKKRSAYQANRLVIWSLILCFPAGLLFMWTERCRWPRALKSGITLFIAAIVIVIMIPTTRPPERVVGGVEIVGRVPAVELYGPEPTYNFQTIEAYTLPHETDYRIVAAPTPTPTPIYVYCNDGGKYYHTKTCRYTRLTTPMVTLSQAIDIGGFKPCAECNPPVLAKD